MELFKNLKEISGLSFYKDNQMACVNNEKGTVFIYNLSYSKVIETIDIGKKWRLQRYLSCQWWIFIWKNNGKIKGLKTIDGSERKIDCSAKDVKEYEGLSYHPKTWSLLLLTKEKTKIKTIKKRFILILWLPKSLRNI